MKKLALWLVPLLAAGCDGMVALEGWAVKSIGGHGDVVLLGERPAGVPEDALDSVSVELWTADGDYLLNRCNSRSGYFSACYVGPYQPGLRYMVKASAPGFAPVSEKVRLQAATGTWARIELVSKAKNEGSTP